MLTDAIIKRLERIDELLKSRREIEEELEKILTFPIPNNAERHHAKEPQSGSGEDINESTGKRRCSKCGKAGHSIRTCPDVSGERPAIRSPKRVSERPQVRRQVLDPVKHGSKRILDSIEFGMIKDHQERGHNSMEVARELEIDVVMVNEAWGHSTYSDYKHSRKQ